MQYIRSGRIRSFSIAIHLFALLAVFGFFSGTELAAQSNDLGNGGRHSIQGRLYVSSRRSQVRGLKIRLSSAVAGDMWVISDDSGTFVFRGLNAGSYTLSVEGGDAFENETENVYIDDPGSSSIRTTVRMRSPTRAMNVQIYLRPKTTAEKKQVLKVFNAKWASVPRETMENYERGIQLAEEDKLKEAEAAFQRAVEVTPSFAPAHTAIGRLLQRAGNLNGAIESWKTAIRHDGKDFDANLNLGIAYLNLKRYPEAEPVLVDAALLDPTAVTPHYYIGIAYVMKNDLDIAMRAFEKARDLNGGKGLPAIHKYLGRIYGAKNKSKEAIQELETYLKLVPDAQDAEKVRKDISDLKKQS